MTDETQEALPGSAGPLAGIRVLDLSRVLAGPYCTMLLGDLGAEVIKIERPGSGDDTRHWGPPFDAGESAYFLSCNRNKKSVAVDLSTPAGQDIVRRLAARSHVLVENFLPGKLSAFGLGWEQVRRENAALVYCSITGFGQDGPRRMEPGYDLLIQAMSGIMSITGEPAGQPMKVGVAIADITAGLFAGNAIIAALLAAQRTGRGDYIDIALMDACMAWLANVGAGYLMTGRLPERIGNGHPNIVPYQAFRARDEWFVVAVGNDGQYRRFCEAIDRPDLRDDPCFASNRQRVAHRLRLLDEIGRALVRLPARHWLERLAAARVPAGPINTLDRAVSDPQVEARGMLVECDHPLCGTMSMIGSPIKLASRPEFPLAPPPALGAHTAMVLGSLLGISGTQLTALAQQGAIGAS